MGPGCTCGKRWHRSTPWQPIFGPVLGTFEHFRAPKGGPPKMRSKSTGESLIFPQRACGHMEAPAATGDTYPCRRRPGISGDLILTARRSLPGDFRGGGPVIIPFSTPVFGHFDTCSGKVGNMGLKFEFEPAGATTQRVPTWYTYILYIYTHGFGLGRVSSVSIDTPYPYHLHKDSFRPQRHHKK